MRGKRQRDCNDFGGWEISRRRINGDFIWQEKRQQRPAAAYEAPPNKTEKAWLANTDVFATASTINSFHDGNEQNPDTTFCQAALYLIIFAIVGIGVCVLFPSKRLGGIAVDEQRAMSEKDDTDHFDSFGYLFASALYIMGAVWLWLYVSFLAIMCLQKNR